MLYKEIIKKLAKSRKYKFEDLAKAIGLSGQSRLSTRLSESWNPGMKDSQELLNELGYEIAFVPKGMIEKSADLSEICYLPEFPQKPAPKNSKK